MKWAQPIVHSILCSSTMNPLSIFTRVCNCQKTPLPLHQVTRRLYVIPMQHCGKEDYFIVERRTISKMKKISGFVNIRHDWNAWTMMGFSKVFGRTSTNWIWAYLQYCTIKKAHRCSNNCMITPQASKIRIIKESIFNCNANDEKR